MTRIYTCNVPIEADVVDAFCWLQKGFTDQFVYYDKQRACRYMGLGRCIALPSLRDVEYEYGEGSSLHEVATGEAAADQPPVFFSFNRFDATNPAPADELMASFPRLRFMLPEIVLIENERGRFLQVNSLGPVYPGRVARFMRMVASAPPRQRAAVPFALEPDSREAWGKAMDAALAAIGEGRVSKVVLSRRLRLVAEHPFSSKDLLVNLIDGDARGTVLLYRYADVFFCGCTPELLVRKRGDVVESMCLAGTCPAGASAAESDALAEALLADGKNRAEHDYVVQLIRSVLDRVCYDVDVPAVPEIMRLAHVQHLFTPARAVCSLASRWPTSWRTCIPPPPWPARRWGRRRCCCGPSSPTTADSMREPAVSWTAPATASFPWPCAPAFSTARWAMSTAAAASSARAMRTPSTRKLT